MLIMKFLLNGEKFGIKVCDVLEVNRLPGVFPVHGADKSIIGLINLHGKSVPVIALDKLLMLRSEGEKKELFVALKTKKGALCLLLDELIGFEEISEQEVIKPEDMTLNFDGSYLEFVCLKSESMVSVLNADFLTVTGRNYDGQPLGTGTK